MSERKLKTNFTSNRIQNSKYAKSGYKNRLLYYYINECVTAYSLQTSTTWSYNNVGTQTE